jgi:hypothetical protein
MKNVAPDQMIEVDADIKQVERLLSTSS